MRKLQIRMLYFIVYMFFGYPLHKISCWIINKNMFKPDAFSKVIAQRQTTNMNNNDTNVYVHWSVKVTCSQLTIIYHPMLVFTSISLQIGGES